MIFSGSELPPRSNIILGFLPTQVSLADTVVTDSATREEQSDIIPTSNVKCLIQTSLRKSCVLQR